MGRVMRWLLMACGLMNLGGVATFAPPFPQLRNQVGLPEAHPLYLWVLTAWLPLFGIAYFWMGWTGKVDRTFLAVGAAGKATFALILFALWGIGASLIIQSRQVLALSFAHQIAFDFSVESPPRIG